jgi:hypothetical protein
MGPVESGEGPQLEPATICCDALPTQQYLDGVLLTEGSSIAVVVVEEQKQVKRARATRVSGSP